MRVESTLVVTVRLFSRLVSVKVLVMAAWNRATTTFASECSINRYYDPATDQFLSIDPDVATTNQPYVFTNDDPLNERIH